MCCRVSTEVLTKSATQPGTNYSCCRYDYKLFCSTNLYDHLDTVPDLGFRGPRPKFSKRPIFCTPFYYYPVVTSSNGTSLSHVFRPSGKSGTAWTIVLNSISPLDLDQNQCNSNCLQKLSSTTVM